MYLISIYFDEKTNKQMNRWIQLIAERTGNAFMLDQKVPPHMTVTAFETRDEELVKTAFLDATKNLRQGKLLWCSVGAFFPYVLYVQPVLNQYLHKFAEEMYDCFSHVEGVKISKYYRPFQWLAHTTLGKTLTKEEMQIAFQVMQEQFQVLEGTVVEVGLAKTNPHRDILRVKINV